MGLWSFDLITVPLSWWKIAYTSIHPGQQGQLQQRQEFSPKITSAALELTNIQDGNIGLQLQVPRGGTHPNGVGSEVTFFLLECLFFYSWFRLHLTAIHCNRREVWTEHLHTAHFLAHLHISSLRTCTYMDQGVARRVFIKELSSTWDHVLDRALSLFALTSSSLSSASTFSLISSSLPSWSSSSMWSKPPSNITPAHAQNE